jgi:hypothetical protein
MYLIPDEESLLPWLGKSAIHHVSPAFLLADDVLTLGVYWKSRGKSLVERAIFREQ